MKRPRVSSRPKRTDYATSYELNVAMARWKNEWRMYNDELVTSPHDVDKLTKQKVRRFLESHSIVVSGSLELCKWRAKSFLRGDAVRVHIASAVRCEKVTHMELPYDLHYDTKSGLEGIPFDILDQYVFCHMSTMSIVQIMCCSAQLYNMGLRFLQKKAKAVFGAGGTPKALALHELLLKHPWNGERVCDILCIPERKRSNIEGKSTAAKIDMCILEYGCVDVLPKVKNLMKVSSRASAMENQYVNEMAKERLNIVENYLLDMGYTPEMIYYKMKPKTFNQLDMPYFVHEWNKKEISGATLDYCIGHENAVQVEKGVNAFVMMKDDRILANVFQSLLKRPHLKVMLLYKAPFYPPYKADHWLEPLCKAIWEFEEFGEYWRIKFMYAFMHARHNQVNYHDKSLKIIWNMKRVFIGSSWIEIFSQTKESKHCYEMLGTFTFEDRVFEFYFLKDDEYIN